MKKDLQLYFDAKSAYYSGEPILSDYEFDTLEVELAKTNPDILKRVGFNDRTGAEKLPVMMGSLDQLHNQKEWVNWKTKFPGELGFVITEKIDGNSCLLQYKNGILVNSWSRGDGVSGASNIRHTSKMQMPQYIESRFTGFIRGELVVPTADWKNLLSEADRDYANARNFVAGFLNKTEGQKELYKYFVFVAFEMIDDQKLSKSHQLQLMHLYGFDTPGYSHISETCSYADLEKFISKMLQDSKYELDGLVVEVESAKYRIFTPTEDDLNPPFSVKIKLVSEGVQTTIQEIQWSTSKDGLCKPVVLINPVQLDGVLICRVTAYNAKFVMDNKLCPGSVIKIVRSGQVIPKIVGFVSSGIEPDLYNEWFYSQFDTNVEWNETKVDLIHASGAGLMAQKAKQLEYFFHKLEIDFVGPGAVSKLIDAGYIEPIKIILDSACLQKIIGENGRKAELIMNKVLASVTPQRLFAALGLFGRGMGERKLKVLFARFSVEQVLGGKIIESHLCELDGFDVKSAKLIMLNAFTAHSTFSAIKAKVTFAADKLETKGSGVFNNQILVATGVRLSLELIEKIQALGGTVTDTFNKSTTMLIAKDPSSTSGKMGKAKDMGIKVISLAQLMEVL
jgi:NAD-dependent DNA ligase